MVKPSYTKIKPLLLAGASRFSRWFSYLGLGIGVLLLLACLQMFINTQALVRKSSMRKNGFDYISVTKRITNDNMGKDNRFTADEVKELKAQPFIDDAAPLISNRFEAIISGGSAVPFSTNVFLESLDKEFIDTVPPAFTWVEGQQKVPLIVSADLLELFNVFAPSYGLPQVSQETAYMLEISLFCEGRLKQEMFRAGIVAFSDRINSVLAPTSFIQYGNKNLEGIEETRATRVYLKTVDANSENLLQYLDAKQYRVNKDKTAFGRGRQIFKGIITALGLFGFLVVVMALMLFSFYLQLLVARSKDNLQLLITLGYSPAWISRNVSRQFIPIYIIVIVSALLVTQLIQWAFHHFVMYDRPELQTIVHWSVFAVASLLVILSAWANYRMVKRIVGRL